MRTKDYPTELDALTKDSYGNPMVCSGCTHSTAATKFPGSPSGERPCFFCVRNVRREEFNADLKLHGIPPITKWYDGTSVEPLPMDCYISRDRIEIEIRLLLKAKK